MANTARERLARLLGDTHPTGSASAQLRAPARLLQLEVSGVEPVSLPVRAPLAKKLIAVARSAMFGRGEETLTDPDVRDTWELTPDQITLGGPDWAALMSRALEHFRYELGLPQTSRLRAEPHSMLVYGKGQFFLPHQDSEKDDETFLSSQSRRTFEWPLATDGRHHIHTQIDSAELPVRHQTRRQGRPYTLVLEKTDELFTHDTKARHKAMTDLAWLTSTETAPRN